MVLPMNEIYQKIGDAVLRSIEKDWSRVIIQVEVEPDVLSFEGCYWVPGSEEPRSFRISTEAIVLFRSLYRQMAQSDKGKWKRAELNIQSDGEFDITFEYE